MNTQNGFLASIQESYESGSRVQIISGDTSGLFWNEREQDYTTLDQTLLSDLGKRFTIVSLDAVGLGFFDSKENAQAFVDIYVKAKQIEQNGKSIKSSGPAQFRFRETFDDPVIKTMLDSKSTEDLEKIAKNKITQGRFDPLAGLAVLKEFFWAYAIVRQKDPSIKPLCVIVRHAGALFPEKDWASLSELDRQRLVYFLNLIADEVFLANREQFILINPSRAEINQRISVSTGVSHLEIQLPDELQRLEFITHYFSQKDGSKILDMGTETFARDTASLPLANIKELMDVARLRKSKLTKADVNAEIDKSLKARIGKFVTFMVPSHGIAECDEQEDLCQQLLDVLLDCNDPETAIAAVLISGPNGTGKTWIAEGVAKECGRVVIVLSGLKDSAYGGTEKITEQLRLVAKTFSNLLFFFDEADTKLGNVRNEGQTHEVTRELYGNLATMMSDPTLLGRVVWLLMTCRPDKFGADMMDRCSVMFAVFDLEGERRKRYIRKQFSRKKLELSDEELEVVVQKTGGLSNRKIGDMIKLFRGRKKRKAELTVSDFLAEWSANNTISVERRLQTLIAAQHCTYSSQLPENLKDKSPEDISKELRLLNMMMSA